MSHRVDGVVAVIRLLRTLDVESLATLIAQRRIVARASSGVVDVAEWLLEPDHVREALQRLGWRGLDRLHRGEPDALATAQSLALAVPGDNRPELFPMVRELTTGLLAGATPVDEAPAAVPVDSGRDARGGERAQALTSLVADLIVEFDATARAARDGRGGPRLAGVEVRRIAVDLDLAPEFVESVADAMYRAGLAGPAGETWVPTALGRNLERGRRIDRWRAMADAWLDALGIDEREAVLGAAEASAPERGIDAVEAATQLGLLVDGALTTSGRHALSGDVDAAAAAMAGELPTEIESVYVQPDLSVIAAGPLAPGPEARLRRVADLERRGTASTYRLSTSSLDRAFASGLTEDEIVDLLADLSLVPLPQPVTYLVAEASARHGLIRVRPFGSGTRIRSDDAAALDHLEVDQALSALRLRRRPDGSLDSLLAPAHVANALTEARHPVMLEDERGTPVGPREPSTAPPPTPIVSAAAQRFATSLRDDADRQGDADESTAWLQQRLDRARRAKATVRIRVRIDDVEPVELTVIPASMSPRWLRVVDPEADVERTFPLAAIELLDD